MIFRIKEKDNKVRTHNHKVCGKNGNTRVVKRYLIDIDVEVVDDGKVIETKRKRTSYFNNKKDALDYLNEFEKLCIEEQKKEYCKSSDTVLDEFLEDSNRERQWKKSTYKTQSDIVRNQLKPFFANCSINDVPNKLINFQTYLNELTCEKGGKGCKVEVAISDSRKQAIYNSMISFLNYMLEKGYTKENLKIKLGRKIIRKGKPRDTELTPDEFKNLLTIAENVCNDAKFIDYLKVMYLTGLRKGEAVGLMVKDVNFKTNEISIKRTYNSRVGYTTPKTESSVRTITVPEQVIDILGKYINEIKRIYGQNGNNVDNLPIFMNKPNLPYADKTLDNRFKPIKDEFKRLYGKDVVLHDLRRSCLTNMGESGVDFKVVKEFAGHTSGITTEQVYVRLRNRHKGEELEHYKHYIDTNFK